MSLVLRLGRAVEGSYHRPAHLPIFQDPCCYLASPRPLLDSRAMPYSIAFLRAINVGGRNVKMEALRAIFRNLGFEGVSTFIASGNVLFDSPQEPAAEVETRIELGLEEALGFEVHAFLRTGDHVAAALAAIPFSEAEIEEAQALNIAFLKAPLSTYGLEGLVTLTSEIDNFHASAREVYCRSLQKQSESKISNALFERKIGGRCTFRSVNSLRRLLAKLQDKPI